MGTVRAQEARNPRSSIARSRLLPPRVIGNTVERARLFDMLDAGIRQPLTVVTGPPGAGKTLLLTSWLKRRRLSAAWLSLESADASPQRFWRAALDAVGATGISALETIAAEISQDDERFLVRFANAISGTRRPLVLILDDFHEIRTGQVCEQLDSLLRHPPEKLHLVIASRADPRLSIHRMRIEGRVAEVRAADLAFTVPEANSMFADARIDLTPSQLSTVHERTEGWAAGLRLAVLSLGHGHDVDALIKTFAGDQTPVAGYLVEEVLQHQPADIREFMLRTSVVDTLEPALANALTERSDSARTLASLEWANAFVTRVGQGNEQYRYHPLFLELLRSQLRHRMPQLIGIGHRRAARWYAKHGMGLQAAEQARAAEDWELAASLLRSQWLSLLLRGESAKVASLIMSLPPRLITLDPEIAAAAGSALLESGQVESGREFVRLASENASTIARGRRREFNLAFGISHLYALRADADFEAGVATARKLLAGNGSDAIGLDPRERRALALFSLGVAETWLGGWPTARSALEDSLALGRHADLDYLVVCALGALALVEVVSGSLRRGDQLAREAIGMASDGGWLGSTSIVAAHCAASITAWQWNSLAEANRQAEAAKAIAPTAADPGLTILVELIRSCVALRLADPERAGSAVRAARLEAQAHPLPGPWPAAMARVEAETLIEMDRKDEASALVAHMEQAGSCAETDLVRAKLALARGDQGAAVEATERALGTVVPRFAFTTIELHAVAAVAEHQRGRDDAALALVEESLALAEPDGYVTPFLTVGSPLRELVVRRIRAGSAHRALAGQLAEALDPHAVNGSERSGGLVLEPLSAREEAVLRYLPTSLSKAEIAAEMFVSVNTVKTHMKNIYRKLDVTDRAGAVRRARTLHLS